ncbi:MAG: hypothetical protein ABJB05_12230 [Parafilimonas sp.]
MKKISLAITIFATVFFLSCKKDASDKAVQAQNISNASLQVNDVCRSDWEGEFDQNKPMQTLYTNDKHIIFEGYAHVPVPMRYTNQPFITKISLPAPDCSNVDADSVRMSISVQNPIDSIDAIYAYNVSLYMYGSTDSAHVNFSRATAIGVGSYVEKNLQSLDYIFNDYTLVTLEAKDHLLSAYVKGKLVGQIDYTGTSIGALQNILIGFTGSGYINYVRLYNSTTGALIMKEDFNVAGKSTDTWYQ